MITKVGVLSLIGAVGVLLGNYVDSLGDYYLIPIGAGIGILATIVDNWSHKQNE